MQSIDWSIPVAFVMGGGTFAAASALIHWWGGRPKRLKVNPRNMRDICNGCTNR